MVDERWIVGAFALGSIVLALALGYTICSTLKKLRRSATRGSSVSRPRAGNRARAVASLALVIRRSFLVAHQ